LEIEGRRRSEKFEDRGRAERGRSAGGALPLQLIFVLVRWLGFKGSLVVGVLCGVAYLLMPTSLRQALLGQGDGGATQPAASGPGACQMSPNHASACDFSRVVLASTEDVWKEKFRLGELPQYGKEAGAYQEPTLVVFSGAVSTAGCGNASSEVGPFYCSSDRKLYIDPAFYRVMDQRLKAPGDFAQAYVIAHEVGHHVQNLIGSSHLEVPDETQNEVSVRVELQADCFAGVWGHSARSSLAVSEADLNEALTAAHAIGDDSLGQRDKAEFTHGTSAQRTRWFRRGFESGDARQCDTFALKSQGQL
jgi:uncharacterized protein